MNNEKKLLKLANKRVVNIKKLIPLERLGYFDDVMAKLDNMAKVKLPKLLKQKKFLEIAFQDSEETCDRISEECAEISHSLS